MTTADLLVLFAYFVAIISIGRYFARRQRDTADFYLGGGNLPWFAVALSAMATLASTVGYVSQPGEAMLHGIGLMLGTLALPLALLVIVFVIVPFYRRAGVTTAFELLGQRYGPSTRLLGVTIWAYMQIAFLGLVLLLASRVIAMMIDVPVLWVILVIGITSVVYTSAGGMRSVVWTDVLQAVIMFAGVVVSMLVVTQHTGTGLATWWQEVAVKSHSFPPLASYDLATRHTVLGTVLFGFVVSLSYAASEQTIIQRYSATRHTVLMMLANYVVSIVYSLLLTMLGAALLVFYCQLPKALPLGIQSAIDPAFTDHAFPTFIVHHLPTGLKGLVIAALLGAAQSTLDSGVNSMSAVFSKDIIPSLNRHFVGGSELSIARSATRIVGFSVVIVAILVDNLPGANNIIDLAQKVVHLGLGPLGALFLGTMLLSRISTLTANTALLSGFACAILLAFHDLVTSRVFVSPILIIPTSWLITLLLIFALSLTIDRGRIIHGEYRAD